MSAKQRLRDVLSHRASAAFVGRERELLLLAECAAGRGPVLTWVHGLAGIGKSALLREFAARAAATGSAIVRLDCRSLEPAPEGFLAGLQRDLSLPEPTIEAVNERMAALRRPVLVFDNYEVLRLLDGWMRQVFVPSLDQSTRVVMAGRFEPGPGWRASLEWHGLLRAIPLSPLSEDESLALLRRVGVSDGEASAVYRLVNGHPMALVLAGGVKGNPDWRPDSTNSRSLMQELSRLYLADLDRQDLRSAVEAASVVRLTTRSMLAAMLPGTYRDDLYDELAARPVVEMTGEGLMIHEQVREAVSSWLRSSDPHRYREYREAAWRQVRSERGRAERPDSWRCTADMLYLARNPALREAFFPTGVHGLAVERATPSDGGPILAIAHRHEVPSAARAIEAWWRQTPDAFSVMRDGSGEVAGFYIGAGVQSLRGRMPDSDPVVIQLQQHLRRSPLAQGDTAFFLRRWLAKGSGEAPSPVQAACWLDVKRSHLGLRPRIRRCYGAMSDIATYAPMLRDVGFRAVDGTEVSIGDADFQLMMLDFGAESFDGWLGELVGDELRVERESILDLTARELVLDGERIGLTPLEFGVLSHLRLHAGKAVPRTDLLEQVWGCRDHSGSNVVDVVVRSLREKLGKHSRMVETVRGVGYRFRPNGTS